MSASITNTLPAPRKLFPWIAPFLCSLALILAGLWIASSLVVLSILVVAVSLWMMHSVAGVFNLRKLNIASFFYLIYLAVILIPGFFVFADEVTASRMRFLFGIESVLISVPVGIFIANLLFDFRKEEIATYFDAAVTSESPKAGLTAFLVILGLGVLLIAINIRETPVIPLLYLIRNPGETLTVAAMREDAFKLLNSPLTYVYAVFRGSVFPFLAMVALGRYRLRKEVIWKRLFWVSLACAVGYASLTIEKSPVATIFGLLFLFSYLFKGGRLSKKTTIAFPIIFLAFPALVMLLSYQGSEAGTIASLIQAIGQRIFYGPAQIAYAYFELFPAIIPFQHGASLVKLAHILGWKTLDIPNVVGLYVTGGIGGIDSVSANGCFIGNLNADFGLPAVVIGGVFAGLVMQMATVYFVRRPKSVANIAGYAACMWSFGLLVASPLPTVLLSGGVAFAVLLAWCLGYRGYLHTNNYALQ
jgi:hypothetical protein